MNNFNISYKKEDFSYYDFSGLELDKAAENELQEQDYSMDKIKEIKEIILKDFRRILENRLIFLGNNKKLIEYMNVLLNSYIEEKNTSSYEVTKFIILTDNYLCFNNVEDAIENLEQEDFYVDSIECETIIIVNRKFSEYYFITMDTNIFDGKVKTSIDSFKLLNNNVENFNISYKGRFKLQDYTEKGVNNAVKRIRRLQQKS